MNDILIYVWLGVFVFTLLLEFCTTDLICVWFSGGALVSLILAICNVNVVIQVIACVVVSALLLIFTRPLLKKNLFATPKSNNNLDEIVGSEIEITEEVSSRHLGQGKLRGITWTLKVENEEVIKKGEYAFVKRVEGNKLIVYRKEN